VQCGTHAAWKIRNLEKRCGKLGVTKTRSVKNVECKEPEERSVERTVENEAR